LLFLNIKNFGYHTNWKGDFYPNVTIIANPSVVCNVRAPYSGD